MIWDRSVTNKQRIKVYSYHLSENDPLMIKKIHNCWCCNYGKKSQENKKRRSQQRLKIHKTNVKWTRLYLYFNNYSWFFVVHSARRVAFFIFLIIIILFVRIFKQEQVKNTTTHLRIGRSVNGFEKLRIFVMIWLVLWTSTDSQLETLPISISF